jgi:hypothetical protein
MVAILPPGDPMQLHALAHDVAGGSEGLSSLSSRFVIVADEAADADDLDGDTNMDDDLVGWIDPASTTLTTFTFQHGTSTNPFVGAGYMAPEPLESRLAIAYQESVPGVSFNSACNDLSLADMDTTDELPTWARFSLSTLVFPGVGVAMAPGNGGIVVNRGVAYFRASEAGQNLDLNGDMDMTDSVLVLNSLFVCDPSVVGTGNDFADTVSVHADGQAGGVVFVTDEALAGQDLNGNGTATDNVLRFFAVP